MARGCGRAERGSLSGPGRVPGGDERARGRRAGRRGRGAKMGGLVSPAPLGSALGGCVGYRGAPRGCRVAASGPASRGAAPAAELRLRRRRRPGSCGDTREQVPHPPLRGPRPVLEAGRGPRPFLGLHRSETVGKDEWSRPTRFCGVRGRACVTAVGVSPRCFRCVRVPARHGSPRPNRRACSFAYRAGPCPAGGQVR